MSIYVQIIFNLNKFHLDVIAKKYTCKYMYSLINPMECTCIHTNLRANSSAMVKPADQMTTVKSSILVALRQTKQ